MEVIIINLLLLLSFFFEATALTKDNTVLYSLCNSTETVSCSSQIPLVNGTENDCVIEPSPICLLEKPEMKNPAVLEKEASYSVSILPILNNSTFTFLSFNISLKTSNSEVTGFYFYITTQKTFNESKDYASCRKFYFKEARKSYQGDISLDYDCYHSMQNPYHYYNVVINAYPLEHHKDLVYRIYTPIVDQIEPTNICEWNPLRMINSVALQRNIVELKFSPAPKYFNVERYFVFLNTSDGQKILAENLKFESNMYRIVFEDVPMGVYILNIIPISSTADLICPGSKTNISVSGIGNFNHQFIFAIIICGSLVVVVLLGFIMHKLCHRLSPRGTDPLELPRPKVIILYSYDCSRHFDVVLKFAEYLKSTCNMDVTLDELDMGEREHVTTWISESITASQFAVVIISRGVHHKAESKNKPPMKEPSPFGDRFIPSLNLLMDKAGHGGNNEDSQNPNSGTCHVIKVIFDYSSRRHVPSTLFKIGPSFYLMNQINEFLCQILAPQILTPSCMVCRTMNYVLSLGESLKIHCQQSKVFPIKIYPKMPGSDFMATSKGKELVKAIEDMRAFQKDDPQWFIKTQRAPEEEASGAMERVEEETKEALEKESDDNAIQLNYDKNRKPSPSYSGKSVTISLNEEKSPECQVLLEKNVKDETV